MFEFLFGRKLLQPVLQSESTECGLACVAMLARYHGHRTTLAMLRRRHPGAGRGLTMAQLATMLTDLQLTPRTFRCGARHLRNVRTPAILWWNHAHFVVLKSAGRGGVRVLDPAEGEVHLSWAAVEALFSGVVMEAVPAPGFRPEAGERSASLAWPLGVALGLAFGIEACSLLLPFQLQLAIDQAIPNADRSLHLLLSLVFCAIVALHSVLAVLRGWLVSWVSVTLNTTWVHGLFATLLRVPVTFVDRRSTADLLSRFASLRNIQITVTAQAVSSVLDGLMSILVLAVLLGYSVLLAAIALGIVGAYWLVRQWLFPRQAGLQHERILMDARIDGLVVEAVRGIKSIKLGGLEQRNGDRMLELATDAGARELTLQRFNTLFNVLQALVAGGGRVLLIAVGAGMSLQGSLSLGMLVAALAFADQLLARGASLFDTVFDFRLLKVDLERVNEVLLEAPEALGRGDGAPIARESIEIRLEGIGFRYSPDEPWLFRHVDFTFEAGQATAIVAPSGVGKSTLIKILVGLLAPTEGRVLVCGREVSEFGLRNLRELCSVVFQDDVLFSGSIADNIAFFDPEPQQARIEDSARKARIHDAVARMPMGYRTPIGESGATLSGGQRQRVVLARALYRACPVLILDEATSWLDRDNIASIDASLKADRTTRIFVSHNPNTIALADTILRLETFQREPVAAVEGAVRQDVVARAPALA
jgi:ATP-binding cassette subfamily B protein RaxB